MDVLQLGPELWVIKNFLSPSECEDIINQVESASEQWQGDDGQVYWKRISKGNRKETLNSKTYTAFEYVLQDKIEGLKFFEDETFIKYMNNGFMGIHYDNFQNEQWIEHTIKNDHLPKNKEVTNQKYSCVLYLNDHEGGELYYPKWDVIYKPMGGDLIIHNANTVDSMHGSMPLKSSERYIFISTVFEPTMVNGDRKIIQGFREYYTAKYPEDAEKINWEYKGLID